MKWQVPPILPFIIYNILYIVCYIIYTTLYIAGFQKVNTFSCSSGLCVELLLSSCWCYTRLLTQGAVVQFTLQIPCTRYKPTPGWLLLFTCPPSTLEIVSFYQWMPKISLGLAGCIVIIMMQTGAAWYLSGYCLCLTLPRLGACARSSRITWALQMLPFPPAVRRRSQANWHDCAARSV